MDLASRALRVAGNDAEVLGNVARVFGYFSEDLAAAISLIDRALELNPSFALGWQWSGWLKLWAGELDPAIGHFETSMRLNPLQGRADYYLSIGMGHFLPGGSRTPRGPCFYHSKKVPLGCRPIAFSRHATRIWDDSTKPGTPFRGCGR